MHVVVALVEQGVPDRVEEPRLAAVEVAREDQVEGLAGLVLVLVVPARVVPAPRAGDLLGGQAEQEHVLLAGLLGDLDGGAVAGADGQGAVHHELHVARAAGLVAGGRDLLGDVAGRDQPLGERDGVVRQELDPELAADVRVVVDHGADVVDQLDDELREPVRRGRLAGEQERPGRDVQRRVRAEAVVADHDLEHVQQLPLVLVDALDLRVEDRVGVERDARPWP